jgi:KAP family P-loop domain
MPIHDGLDNPGSDPKEDAFNRWPFSKRLADTIAEFDTSNGAPVIGIFGRWGYGKSTVLNYIKRELETTHQDKVVLFEFNPWFFTTEEELIAGFLIGLTSKLQLSLGSRWKDFGKLLEKGSGLFGMIPFVGSGAQKLSETLGKELAKDSLQNQRRQAIEIMRNATRTVVVLIDDLDRLEPQEALTMLRLVRLNASFPRVIYVLAFDDEMVAKAAGVRYGGGSDSGRHFLEKIVQYPFTLPAVGLRRLVDFVVQHARGACEAADVELSDEEWQTFQRLVDRYLSRRLTTPRQAIRYANALRFALPLLKGEVSAFEQMLVEGIRVLFPELYAYLRDDVRSVTSLVSNGTIRDLAKGALQDHAATVMGGSPPSEIAAATEVVQELFRNPGRPKSIARVRYFDRYFSYAVPVDDISDSDLAGALHSNCNSDELAALFKHLATPDPERLATPDPERLIHAVTAIRPQLQPEATLAAAIALAHNGQMFISNADELLAESTQPTFDPLALQMINLLAQLVFDLPNTGDLRDRAVASIIEAADPLQIAIVFYRELRNISRLFGRSASQSESPRWGQLGFSHELRADDVTESLRQALATSIDKRFREFAATEPKRMFDRASEGPSLLIQWCGVPGEGTKSWLEGRFVAEPADAVRFVSLLRRERHDFWSLSYYPVSAIVDTTTLADTLRAYLAGAQRDAELSPEDMSKAERFVTDYPSN